MIVNDYSYDEPNAAHFVELAAVLSRFKGVSDANKVDVIIKVIGACAHVGIKMVNFAMSEEV